MRSFYLSFLKSAAKLRKIFHIPHISPLIFYECFFQQVINKFIDSICWLLSIAYGVCQKKWGKVEHFVVQAMLFYPKWVILHSPIPGVSTRYPQGIHSVNSENQSMVGSM